MKTNAFSTWTLWAITMIAGFLGYHYLHPALGIYWVAAGSFVLLCCSFFPLTLYAGRGRFFAPTGIGARETSTPSGFSDEQNEQDSGDPVAVDPWNLQRHLMALSDQRLPSEPTITREVLMYYALILEEASEGGVTLCEILRGTALSSDQLQDFTLMRQTMASAMRSMSLASRRIRELLAAPAFQKWDGRPLALKEARMLLDDHVDIQVVNSGFGLAAGLPCDTGYLTVGVSNVSKADPATGKILKDDTGKWIKGPDYQPPQLEELLLEQFPNLRPAHPRSDFAPTQPISTL